MQQKQMYTSLMTVGCLPFVVAALGPYFGVFELPFFGNLQTTVAYYGLAIVSFMAGMQWGISLMPSTSEQPGYASKMCPIRMMLASNVFVLVPWLIVCALGVGVSYYFSLAVTFMLMVLTDYRLMSRGILSGHYYQMRLIVTGVVVVSLVSLAFTVV